MKLLASTFILTIIISSYVFAQRDFALIDHTTRSNTFNAIQLTDSVIYYSLEDHDFLFAQTTFNSIDSAGARTCQLVWNGSSQCKFIPQGNHHITVFYHDLFEGDFGMTGFYKLDKNLDQTTITFHDVDIYLIHDIEINEDNEVIILSNQKLSIYDPQDLLLLETDFPHDQHTYFIRNKNEIYLVTQNIIYHLNGYALNPVYNSTEPIYKVLPSEQDELYIVYDNEIKSMSTIDLSVSDLLTYDIPQKTQVEYNRNQEFIFKNKVGDVEQFILLDSSGNSSLVYESLPGEFFKHVKIISNQLYLNGTKSDDPVSHTFFKKTSIDDTNDSAICKDAIIRYAEIEHIGKTFHSEVPTPFGPDTVFRYDYTYLITIENTSTDSINRLDIYSSTFQQGGFISYRYLHFTIADLGPSEIKTISGELVYYSSEGKIDPQQLYLSGVDYFLDCNPSDNTYDVSNIVSSTIGLKPIKTLTLFPNPSNDYLYINKIYASLPYAIHSPQGNTIVRGIYTGKIDVADLSPGIYLLNIAGKMEQFVKL